MLENIDMLSSLAAATQATAPTTAQEPLADEMFQAQVDRAMHIDDQVRQGIEVVKSKNERLEALNQEMAELRNEKAATTDEEERRQIDLKIENLRGEVETLTSTSQLEMVSLQSQMHRYTNSFELVSNFVRKFFGTISNIIGNLR